MQVGIRTKDRWPQLACLLARLVSEPVDRLILVNQSVTLPPAHVVALLSLFREVDIVQMDPDPISAQRLLFARAGDGFLLQLDDDVLPIVPGFVRRMEDRLRECRDLAFVIGCTREVGRPSPPDSPDPGFPNYLRWHPGGAPQELRPSGIAFCFTGVRLSIVPALEEWLRDDGVWDALLVHQETQLNDVPYGVAAEALGYRAEMLPSEIGFHLRPEGGEDTLVTRNAARGRVLCDLLFRGEK